MAIRLCLLSTLAVAAVAAPIRPDALQPLPLVTTFGNPNSGMYLTDGVARYDGVAQLIIESAEGIATCTGALLSSGIHVLTAAHCLATESGVTSLSVTFYPSGAATPEVIEFADASTHPEFTGSLSQGNDVGLVRLKRPPSAAVPRYQLYSGSGEIGSEYEVVGFGATGQGAMDGTVDGLRRRGWNTFDATMSETFGEFPGWTGGDGVLISDFDNGRSANDALGVFYGIAGTGLGRREASMAPGDSGAPAFIGDTIAGVASFRLRLNFTDGSSSDVDDISNASFGEFNAFTRVSSHSSWLQPVPEPGSGALCAGALGVAALGCIWRRRKRRHTSLRTLLRSLSHLLP
jgi:secreted trypsin-like serine protease